MNGEYTILDKNYTAFYIDKTQRLNREEIGKAPYPMKFHYVDFNKLHLGYVQWHWHPEFELNMVFQGSQQLSIGKENIVLSEGDGCFINATTLHSISPSAGSECIHIGCVFAPDIISGGSPLIFQKYVKPIQESQGLPCIALRRSVPWQRNVLDRIFSMYDILDKGEDMPEISTRILLCEIWMMICGHYREYLGSTPGKAEELQEQRVKLMSEYINEHFSEPIELSDIAERAHISVREAIRCFNNVLSMTPKQYLLDRRVTAARYLLEHSTLTITEVAMDCGFNSSSYFSKIFTRHTGVSPHEYRKRLI